jgi:pimeloyl-ACP methyl ester carboxylesterase
VRADLQEAFQREAIIERLKSVRVPTLLLRAENGFTPGQPPLFPDALAMQLRTYLPHFEDHKFTGTTHYTIALGQNAAASIADLICELASRSRSPAAL